jgi:hypothetical protein
MPGWFRIELPSQIDCTNPMVVIRILDRVLPSSSVDLTDAPGGWRVRFENLTSHVSFEAGNRRMV